MLSRTAACSFLEAAPWPGAANREAPAGPGVWDNRGDLHFHHNPHTKMHRTCHAHSLRLLEIPGWRFEHSTALSAPVGAASGRPEPGQGRAGTTATDRHEVGSLARYEYQVRAPAPWIMSGRCSARAGAGAGSGLPAGGRQCSSLVAPRPPARRQAAKKAEIACAIGPRTSG